VLFIKTGIFSRIEETPISLERKPYVLEEGACSTLFPCENWVSFWKEYFRQIIVFKVAIR